MCKEEYENELIPVSEPAGEWFGGKLTGVAVVVGLDIELQLQTVIKYGLMMPNIHIWPVKAEIDANVGDTLLPALLIT